MVNGTVTTTRTAPVLMARGVPHQHAGIQPTEPSAMTPASTNHHVATDRSLCWPVYPPSSSSGPLNDTTRATVRCARSSASLATPDGRVDDLVEGMWLVADMGIKDNYSVNTPSSTARR